MVPGHCIIEPKQFRAVADEGRGVGKVWNGREQPGPDDIQIEPVRKFDTLHLRPVAKGGDLCTAGGSDPSMTDGVTKAV